MQERVYGFFGGGTDDDGWSGVGWSREKEAFVGCENYIYAGIHTYIE